MPDEAPPQQHRADPSGGESSNEAPIVRVDISLAPSGLRARIAEQQLTASPSKPADAPSEAARVDTRTRELADHAQALAAERAALTVEREQMGIVGYEIGFDQVMPA